MIEFPKYTEPNIEIIQDLSPLNDIQDEVAIDIEATGIKPHAEGHQIVCCAVADTPSHAYVFMMPESRAELRPLKNLLMNKDIKKIIHNCKYELAWFEVILRTIIEGEIWDTMLAAHILDNRQGITSLAFQVYINFGISDFKDETNEYLNTKNETSANDFNRILELIALEGGKEMLMKRCALDTIFEYKLYMKQQEEILDLPF